MVTGGDEIQQPRTVFGGAGPLCDRSDLLAVIVEGTIICNGNSQASQRNMLFPIMQGAEGHALSSYPILHLDTEDTFLCCICFNKLVRLKKGNQCFEVELVHRLKKSGEV